MGAVRLAAQQVARRCASGYGMLQNRRTTPHKESVNLSLCGAVSHTLPTCRQSCGSTPDSQLSAELNDKVSSPERCVVDSHGEMIGTSIVCMLLLFFPAWRIDE